MAIKFKMNRRIEILTENEKKIGNSTVQDEDENYVYISVPFDSNGIGQIKPGDKIVALYSDDDNKLYNFETEVHGFTQDRIPLVKILKSEEYEVIQRRQHVRIPVLMDVEYIILDDIRDIHNKSIPEIKEIYEDKKWEKGYTFDLSAGGMGVIMRHSVEMDDKLLFIINDVNLNISVTGKVTRVVKNKDSRKLLYRIGICFTNLNFNKEEKVIRFIFLKMREQLKVR